VTAGLLRTPEEGAKTIINVATVISVE
jgi:hypothetical protein